MAQYQGKKTALDFFEEAIKTYKDRNKVYGKNYYRFGEVMKVLFPEGIFLQTEGDFNRYGGISAIVGKLCRYANSFEQKCGHTDSIHDLGVYAFIQQELDNYYRLQDRLDLDKMEEKKQEEQYQKDCKALRKNGTAKAPILPDKTLKKFTSDSNYEEDLRKYSRGDLK